MLGLKPPPTLGSALGWWWGGHSQQCCACKSIDVISNLFLPWTVCLVLSFLNLQATDWSWCPVIPCFLCIMLQITAVFTHRFHLHSKHITLLLSMAHSGERKRHIYSCTPVSKLLSQSSLSAQVKWGDWKKECLYLDDGGWWGGKSASHCIWWYNAYITGSRILTFYPREIGAINRELSKMLDAVHLLILFFFY